MNIRRSIVTYSVGVVTLHVLGIALLVPSLSLHPTLFALGSLAYTFGLRHAFDADHIAAIDNTVRKLRQEGKDPIGVGFFFALGHSTIVILMASVTVFAVHWAQWWIPTLQSIGGVVGAIVSATFLLIIGLINSVILVDLYKSIKKLRTDAVNADGLEKVIHSRGVFTHVVRPLFKVVNKSWHVYPIGLLFGLSFDTASEVALLTISAESARSTTPFTCVLALPILFSAGMALMDTADGMFMTTAYNWALATPMQKVYYNVAVTGLSAAVALVVGLVEVVQVVSSRLELHQGIWDRIQNLDFGTIGYLLVGMFVLTWVVSYGVWKFVRVEQR